VLFFLPPGPVLAVVDYYRRHPALGGTCQVRQRTATAGFDELNDGRFKLRRGYPTSLRQGFGWRAEPFEA
jgi:hypothetical protein